VSNPAKPRVGGKQDTGEYRGLSSLLQTLPKKMQKIEGLENLMNLEELWLGKNKITKLEVSLARSPVSASHSLVGLTKPQKTEDSFDAIEQDNEVGGTGRSRRT
jgi:hypothetical protein